MYDQTALLADIELSLTSRSSDWHASALCQLTALFLAGDRQFSAQHVALFDSILSRFVVGADHRTLTEISERLAQSPNAPKQTIEILAKHKSLPVARPMLAMSACLSDEYLVEVVLTAGRDVLMLIARRKAVGSVLADALIERRDPVVNRALFANSGAKVSEMGFVQMIDAAKIDDTLLAAIRERADVPTELKPFFELAANPAG